MGNINVTVRHGSTNITSHIVSYQTERRICTGIGTITLEVSIEYSGTFDPWDVIKLYENGQLSGTYFVNEAGPKQPSSTFTVVAQDASKYLVDYFISEPTTIETPQYNKTWIINTLEEAGIDDYRFNTSDPGTLISNNTTLGMNSAYDQLMYLVQISGWYFYFDQNNTCIIGKLDTDLANPRASLNSNKITEFKKIDHDKMLRNRVVVWGTGSGVYAPAVGVEVFKITPWNYDADDLRTIVISNSNIPSSGVATQIAQNALDYFDEITQEKHFTAEGAYNVNVGDAIKASTKIWKGKGLLTTFGTELSENGLVSNFILDEKCPRLFAYFDFGDYVYIGTTESGVYRKHIKYLDQWYNYNGGYLPSGEILGISDLFVRGDVGAAVTFSGLAAYCDTNTYPADWQGIDLSNISAVDANESPIVVVNSDVKARACTIDRTSLDVRLLLDTWSGRNYKNYVDMYYNRFSSPYFLFSGQLYNGITPLADNFSLSGYMPGSGHSDAWVLSLSPSGVVNSVGLFPINFSGITSASGGYSVMGFDLENDGAFDYASVRVDRDPIFYLNTVYGGENYITGYNVTTRESMTHIHTSGVIVDTSDPASVLGHNVGNMMASRKGSSGKIVLLDNHTIDSTIPTLSGEYDFGTAFRRVEYTSSDYVSLTATPSGTFMDDIVDSVLIYTMVDRIGSHQTFRWQDIGAGLVTIKDYNFSASGWTLNDSIDVILPEYENGIPANPYLSGPLQGQVYTTAGDSYGYMAYGQTALDPLYRWLWVTVHSGGTVNVTELTEDVTITPPIDFVDGGVYYLTYGGGGTDLNGTSVGGTAYEPRYLTVFNVEDGTVETSIIFDGLPTAWGLRGQTWYRLKVFKYKSTYQVIGFAFVYDDTTNPGNPFIEVYPIASYSSKAVLPDDPIYIETDVDGTDAGLQTQFRYAQLTEEWSLAWYEAKESNPTFGWLGDTKASIINYGAHGYYVIIPPITEWLGGTDYTDPVWMEGADVIATPISDEIFDNIAVLTHSADGTFISFPPFLERGQPISPDGHDIGSRPYTRPESTKVRKYMVLKRDGNDYDIVTGGASFPYRLDSSHPSPLVTDGLYRFGFETYYVSQIDVTQVKQLHPLSGLFASGIVTSSGVGFDIINDFRYASLNSFSTSGLGQQLFYTASGGLWTTPIGDYSTFTLYSGYTNGVASGVILGSAHMIETSNFAYPEQYLFMSTINGSNDFRFYQKDPSGIMGFEDCSLYSGYPNSEICIIRLEDLV